MNCPLNHTVSSPSLVTIHSEWRKDGKDKTCSYCGSWHPLEFLKFLPEVVSNPDNHVRIELNDKRNKIYIYRPHVKNAKEGAIKIYIVHLKQYIETNEYNVDEIDGQLHKAFMVSRDKFDRHISSMMEDVKNKS